ncbi:MAG TPA: type 4 pilus major pilin [Gammaproteobacteria bacterium]|nr:type 4 pilus major pilin [Gammaproteobacteria bacterium]
MLKQLKRERGIGLLELMLSLSIIAILLVMATRYFMVANESQKLNNAVSEVNGIAGGAANYDLSYPGYAGMTMTKLIDGRFVPGSLGGSDTNGTGANPWGGNLEVPTPTAGQGFVVKVTGVPFLGDDANTTTCKKLANMISSSVKGSAVCDGAGTVTVTFY